MSAFDTLLEAAGLKSPPAHTSVRFGKTVQLKLLVIQVTADDVDDGIAGIGRAMRIVTNGVAIGLNEITSDSSEDGARVRVHAKVSRG